MKSKEELNAIKNEVEAVSKKLNELSDEELEQVVGGVKQLKKQEIFKIDISGKFDRDSFVLAKREISGHCNVVN